MTISSLSAAKKACEVSNWKLTNLSLQKILYIAHMVYMGNHEGRPLLDENFQAWAYGPVLPNVYHRVKAFGNSPVRNIFHSVPSLKEGPEAEILVDAVEKLSNMSAGKLVAITHWDKGAWNKHYIPGKANITIPNRDILDEYRERNDGK